MIINIEKRYAYAIIGLLILGIGIFVVYAYGDTYGDPAIMGHSANEFAPPSGCEPGQVLRFIDGDSGWGCVDVITSESDPTVLASVKDGVSWGELSGMPSGFADGVDDVSGVGCVRRAKSGTTSCQAFCGTYGEVCTHDEWPPRSTAYACSFVDANPHVCVCCS